MSPLGAYAQAGHIAYDYPAGGRQGSKVAVVVGGQSLRNTSGVYISGTGVHGILVSIFQPLGGTEFEKFMDRLRAARDKLAASGAKPPPLRLDDGAGLAKIGHAAGLTDSEIYAVSEYDRVRRDPKIQPNPQLADKVMLQIQIDSQALPGVRELRLTSPAGLTNLVRFVVGEMPEQVEAKPSLAGPISIGDQLPLILNGQILPGDVDHYTFHGHRGMSLAVVCDAEKLTPYLADTVPGWFQPALTVYDPQGREIAYADHFQFHPDPALKCMLQADGDYALEVRDAIYRGREDFVYRVSLGEIPLLESIFPLGGPAGTPATVSVAGWNLPRASAAVDTAGQPGTRLVSVRGIGADSNALPFVASDLPEALEKGPNDRPSLAQAVTLPVVVNGKIDVPGGAGVYKFTGRAGETIVIEVQARRLGSPLDSVVKVMDQAGHVLAIDDDFVDKGAGLVTHQADSYLTTTLPAAGIYFVAIKDAQHKGGPDYAYRLRISEPRPDFDLRVIPSAINVRAGGSANFNVTVIRRDGFTGDINLALKNVPPGITLGGGPISGKVDSGTASIRVTDVTPTGVVWPVLEGVAKVNGVDLRRAAVPADDMEQAFAYHHLVPAGEWLVYVTERYKPKPAPPAKPVAPAKPVPAAPKPASNQKQRT